MESCNENRDITKIEETRVNLNKRNKYGGCCEINKEMQGHVLKAVIILPMADVVRGIVSCPFIYTYNLSLLGSNSQEDL